MQLSLFLEWWFVQYMEVLLAELALAAECALAN